MSLLLLRDPLKIGSGVAGVNLDQGAIVISAFIPPEGDVGEDDLSLELTVSGTNDFKRIFAYILS